MSCPAVTYRDGFMVQCIRFHAGADEPDRHEGFAGDALTGPRVEWRTSADHDEPTTQKFDRSDVGKFEAMAVKLGRLVDSKQLQYGDSAGRAGRILAVLYPGGIRVDQYDDALLVVRILDKLSRISSRGADGKDRGGESPYGDIAGYGLLGMRKDGQ